MSGSVVINMEDVRKEFGDLSGNATLALGGISLQVASEEFVALVGPSGCGKSTVLNLIAGFDRPSTGQVRYRGSAVAGPNTRVGYMTQKDTLLPWKTVGQNIALALEIRRWPRSEISREVSAYVKLMNLEGFEEHYPAQLSGGMRRRVTLARTLIYRPETLLMDEPFGALDAQLRVVLQGELLRILAETRRTVLFVTHDLGEAVALADRVVVMSQRPGVIRACREVPFSRPRDLQRLRFAPEYVQLCEELWEQLGPSVVDGQTR